MTRVRQVVQWPIFPSSHSILRGQSFTVESFRQPLLNEARLNGTRFASDQQRDASNTNFGIPRIEVEGLPFDRIRFGAARSENTPGHAGAEHFRVQRHVEQAASAITR